MGLGEVEFGVKVCFKVISCVVMDAESLERMEGGVQATLDYRPGINHALQCNCAFVASHERQTWGQRRTI